MALNPIVFTEKVVRSFLRYQLTAYPFADEKLYGQMRRLRAFCGVKETGAVCVATSATIVDKEEPDAARSFASRFFGVPEQEVVTVGEAYEREVWGEKRFVPAPPKRDTGEILNECVKAVEVRTPKGSRWNFQ